MPLSTTLGGLHDPDSVALITHVVGIEEVRRELLCVGLAAVGESVGVVGQHQLALANQFPDVSVERAVIHVDHVDEIHRLGTREWLVVADWRDTKKLW